MLRLIYILKFVCVIYAIRNGHMFDNSIRRFFDTPFRGDPDCPWTSIVTISASNDFATQMWEYCTVYAVGRYTGLDPFVPPLIHKKLSLIFQGLSVKSFARIARKCKFNRKKFVFDYASWTNMDKSLLISKGNIELNLVLKYLKFLLDQFKLTEIFKKPSSSIIKKALKQYESNKLIGIYINKIDFEYENPLLAKTVDFYEKGLQYFRNEYRNVTFIALCGINAICLDIFKEQNDVYIYKYNNIERLTIAILSLCNHVIFKTGGIGLWGGLLSGGEIIYSFCETLQINKPGNYTIIQRLIGTKKNCDEYDYSIENVA
ncbi:galactoside alpha-(1,2)-fucosyltransferase 2-like [Onthophagus taurus]|uniref:galactoside alpha-(1,2)-fucosyltransferase 2-like n=1 Tax=Onthophagus taurus TaxID=166361 RepID=UPI0039BE0E0D